MTLYIDKWLIKIYIYIYYIPCERETDTLQLLHVSALSSILNPFFETLIRRTIIINIIYHQLVHCVFDRWWLFCQDKWRYIYINSAERARFVKSVFTKVLQLDHNFLSYIMDHVTCTLNWIFNFHIFFPREKTHTVFRSFYYERIHVNFDFSIPCDTHINMTFLSQRDARFKSLIKLYLRASICEK